MMTIVDLVRGTQYITVAVGPMDEREEDLRELARLVNDYPEGYPDWLLADALERRCDPRLDGDDQVLHFTDLREKLAFYAEIEADPGLADEFVGAPESVPIDPQEEALDAIRDAANDALRTLLYGPDVRDWPRRNAA